jgi:AcrR family transcriptional regulator
MKSSARSLPRPYRQTARAEAAEETARRIVDAFGECVRDRWFNEVTLDEVAGRAGVTVRTVIRRFGGKPGLLAAFMEQVAPQVKAQRTAAPGDVDDAVDRILAVYEDLGDSVIRHLSQESLHPEIKPLLDMGRSEHRAITAETFATWLEPLSAEERRRTLDALVIAMDIYCWKLLRRDMNRSLAETRAVMLRLVNGILAGVPKGNTSRRRSHRE